MCIHKKITNTYCKLWSLSCWKRYWWCNHSCNLELSTGFVMPWAFHKKWASSGHNFSKWFLKSQEDQRSSVHFRQNINHCSWYTRTCDKLFSDTFQRSHFITYLMFFLISCHLKVTHIKIIEKDWLNLWWSPLFVVC